MNNKGLLIVIVLLLVGILGIVFVQYHENRKSPGEKISEGVSEAIEEVGDEIDDHTTSR